MNAFRIKTKVNALTGLCLVVALTVTLVLLWRMEVNLRRNQAVLTSYMRQIELARIQQLNFKKQVQEWKDILLRGHDAGDFEEYRRLFLKQESLVQENRQALKGALTQPALNAKADEFSKAHDDLGRQYRRALEGFEQSGRLDYQSADRLVRGLDRRPTDLIDEIIGAIEADFDHYKELHTGSLLKEQHYTALTVLTLFLGLMVASILISRRITRPIYNLAQTVSKVSTEKDYSLRAVRSSRDELGLLTDGFNEMLAQVQLNDAVLQRSNDALEERVAERTHELQQINQTLQTEVAEHARAEEALRRSETKFRTLYDSSSDAVMLLDMKGFFDCNPATLAMFGCANREEFCAKHPAHFSPLVQPDGTDSRTLANQRIATAMENGSHHFEWLHKRADTGEIFPADVLFSAMELDGKPVLQAVVRNITERKQMEDKLRQLSRAVEQSPASIVITDPAGNIEYANSKFIQVTGYTAADVLGKNPRVLKSGDQSPETYRELWQTIAAGKEWRGEFHNKKKNGERYWEIASISPIRDLAGHITHFVAVKEDITERKKEEAQREFLIKNLEEALANVKSLSGLLPICAGCKKIRDDKGYWNQVEGYIQKHTEATFSHGMCPDCLKKFYPWMEDDGDGDPPKPAA